MRKAIRYAPILVFAIAACESGDPLSPDATRSTPASSTAPRGFAQETYIDYAKPAVDAGLPVATTESDDYSLEVGGISWFSGSQVEYAITGTPPVTGANTAIDAAVATVDGYVLTRTFAHNNATSQTNPCGHLNTIEWVSIDGPGRIVGATSFCYFVATKEIVGFKVILDQDESWSIGGTSTTYDVQNAATHEFGHAVGLGHVHAPMDGCLTMYPYIAYGEIQKRTLGLGDKLGMEFLYGSNTVTAGSCGS